MMLLATLSLAAAASAADSPVELARALIPPTPVAKRDAAFEDEEFYQRHGELLRAAWREHGLQIALLPACKIRRDALQVALLPTSEIRVAPQRRRR